MSSFKILSLDGGGFRGIYSAYILKRIEEEYNIEWNKHFQMISGTSTGSIIAAGLAIGMKASEIYNFYEEHGKNIFKKFPLKQGYFSSQYKSDYLKKVLNDVFQKAKLGDISTPLIIPSTDIGNGRVHVFKSGYDKGFKRDKNVLIKDSVLASCSAPTYFNPHNVDVYMLADGGLWANNPSLVSVIDAKNRLKVNMDDIKVFSLGTGIGNKFYSQKDTFFKRLFGWGFLTRWGRSRFIDMLLNLQSQTADNMLGLLLDKDKQVLRINFESDQELSLSDTRNINDWAAKADKDFTYNSARIKEFLEIGDVNV